MLVVTILSMSQFQQYFPLLRALRPGVLVYAFVLLYVIAFPRSIASGTILNRWSVRVMAAFFIMACLSAVFGISIGNSGKFILSSYAKDVAFGVLVVLSIRSARDLYHFVWAYVISMCVLGSLIEFVFERVYEGGTYRINGVFMYDANDIGLLLVLGVPLCLLAFYVSRGIARWAALGALVASVGMIGLTGSRGAFLAVFGVGLGLLLLSTHMPIWKRAVIVLTTALGLMIWSPVGYWDRMLTMTNPVNDYNFQSESGRKAIWTRGVQYMTSHPFFGIGIDNFGKMECSLNSSLVRARGDLSGTRCGAAHSSIVQAGAELGVPGLILWLTLMLGTLWRLLRFGRRVPLSWGSGNPEERLLRLAPQLFAVSLIGFMIGSTFLTFAWHSSAYFIPCLLAGLETSLEVKMRRDAGATVRTKRLLEGALAVHVESHVSGVHRV
jgi:O-antigen ligase